MRKIYWILKRKSFESFLWPNKIKTTIFAALLFSVLFYSLSVPRVYYCLLPPCPNSEWLSLPWRGCPICMLTAYDYVLGLVYYSIFPFSFSEFFMISLDLTTSFVLLTAQLLYWYLISCFIERNYERKRTLRLNKY